MNIYVGNLPYGLSEDDLKNAFAAFGEVAGVKIIIDQMTGKSKGFGFVEMENDEHAQQAIDSLNGTELNGRNIVVNKSRPKTGGGDNRRGGGNGGGRPFQQRRSRF
jgi:RNA recognition motif-containing protein